MHLWSGMSLHPLSPTQSRPKSHRNGLPMAHFIITVSFFVLCCSAYPSFHQESYDFDDGFFASSDLSHSDQFRNVVDSGTEDAVGSLKRKRKRVIAAGCPHMFIPEGCEDENGAVVNPECPHGLFLEGMECRRKRKNTQPNLEEELQHAQVVPLT